MRLLTERFLLRPLTAADATERYVAWFDDDVAKKTIHSAADNRSLEKVRAYINERADQDDVLFLGIFTKDDELHIGNVKYEPVDSERGYAVMGILIGDVSWRGKGVATEVLRASGEWLRENAGIRELVLGVHKDNPAAIRSYEKAGYRIEATDKIKVDPKRGVSMILRLEPPSQ
jgi:RimJ/RimL family protein N-acetyltransferase